MPRSIDEPFEVSQDIPAQPAPKDRSYVRKATTADSNKRRIGPKSRIAVGKAIKPGEVVEAKKAALPPEVLDAFNELIAKYWTGHSATVKQPEVARLIASKLGLENTSPVYDNHWLDVEDVYRKEGWKVKYDKPGYNESYDAYFEFSK